MVIAATAVPPVCDELDLGAWAEPVSLDELDTVASLQTRVDRKYILDLPRFAAALESVDSDGRMGVLEIAGNRWFEYESLYYDTPDRSSFRHAAHRHRNRYKVRVRTYVSQASTMLEVKTKDARGNTVKDRQSHPIGDSHELSDDGLEFVDHIVGPIGISPIETASLIPAIATRYQRSTLLLRSERDASARLTVDRCVEWSNPGANGHPITDDLIIETKSQGQPTSMDRALWAAGVRPRRVSKFALAMILADPSLPANRWHRILRDHCSIG